MTTILIVLLFLIPFLWVPASFYTRLLRKNVQDIRQLNIIPPKKWPTVSIIIAACNEGSTIVPALKSLLLIDYPRLEIIVVNDRSTDDTAAKIASLQSNQIQTITIDALPEGWLGKVHALHKGTEQATGSWLLFTDADVHFSADLLKIVIGKCEQQEIDFLTLLPLLHSRSFWAQCCICTALRFISISQKPWHAADPQRKEAIGAGAFNLVRRKSFDQTEGFTWLKMEVADDIGLGHMLKASQARCQFYTAINDLSVEWYPTLYSAIKGLEKNAFAQIARFSLIRGLVVSGLLLLFGSVPFFAFHPLLFPWAFIPIVFCAVFSAIQLHPISRIPLLTLITSFVFGDILLSFIIIRATILGIARGGVIWRDTVYKSEDLKKGTRIQF
jgi:glycosyltransferase involved in cell wall biosynthesis